MESHICDECGQGYFGQVHFCPVREREMQDIDAGDFSGATEGAR